MVLQVELPLSSSSSSDDDLDEELSEAIGAGALRSCVIPNKRTDTGRTACGDNTQGCVWQQGDCGINGGACVISHLEIRIQLYVLTVTFILSTFTIAEYALM